MLNATFHPRRLFGFALAATLAFRFWLAAVLPITGDEAYFIYWGAQPDWGFYDHPPMVGWWLALLLQVSWDEWWLRLPSILLPAVLALSTAAFLRRHGEEAAWTAALLVLLAPAHVWNVAITTDTPLVFFSFFSALAFIRAARDDDYRFYLLAGVLLGAAFLSKYFAVLLGLAFSAYALWRPTRRKLAGLALVVLGAAPGPLVNIAWNMGHCWANIMFNLYNRHEGAGWSWKTPLLYVVMLAYLLTPVALWQLLRRPLAPFGQGPQSRALAVISVVPLALFALLSLVKTVGMHWVLSFLPFVLMALVLAADGLRRRALARFFIGFALFHGVLVVATSLLPVETWKRARIYGGIVLTVKAPELLQALAPYERDFVFASDGYSNAVTLSYNARRYFFVFGEGSSHARHDDIMTDVRALDGRNILVLRKTPPDEADYRPYFREVDFRSFEVRGAVFYQVLGRGFDYAAYRDGVLAPVREKYYQVPAWLPLRGCYFCERYFRGQCRAPEP